MYIRGGRPIGLPKSTTGHFDHFNVIGLETFVDRANASHAPRCDGQLAGESSGATKCDEQRRCWASLKSRTDPVDLSHADSPRPPLTSTMRLPEHPHHPIRTPGAGRGLVPAC